MPKSPPPIATGPFAGLELLSSAVVLVDGKLVIRYINPGAENLFAISQRKLLGLPLSRLLGEPTGLGAALENALHTNWSYTGQDLTITRGDADPIRLDCTVSPVDTAGVRLLLEFRPIDAQLRVAREEQLLQQQQANRELIRNLAHEIKNPLGGIRGSAQLLQHELDDPQLREFTDVIIAEADRLQDLMNRLLSSHCMMRPAPLNIHDVLERVRRLILAEFPALDIRRDYDLSLPELTADREQLIRGDPQYRAQRRAGAGGPRRDPPAHPHRAPGHAGQASLQAGTGLASDRQRSRHSSGNSRQDLLSAGFGTRWRQRAGPVAGPELH